jgi:outer membrane protein TolC
MRRIIALVFVSLFLNYVHGQTTFSDQRFYELVVNNHPLAKQANLKPDFGKYSVLKAKGGFDPKLENEINQKYYNSSNYYSFLNAGLKIPTWYGIEVKSGFEMNEGSYLSPQYKTPAGGLWYGGVAVNLGEGLFIDQRRAELFKARIYQNSTLFEQRLQLNELLYEAGYAYWNWVLAYHSMEIMQDSYQLANERYEGIRRTAEVGDRPGIDSVEAIIQVQSRETLLRNYETDFKNNGYNLSTFLWTENLEPLELDNATVPVSLDSVSLESSLLIAESTMDSLVNNHPYLKINGYKIQSLEVDNRLKREQLKPDLALQYNFLNEPVNYNPFNDFSINNYKWGLTFEMPIFLRKERGDVALSNLKIQDEKFNLQNNQAYIEYKIRKAMADYSNGLVQITIYEKTVKDSGKLLEAEKQMFEAGESSLFLINQRELAFIQARLKLIESQVKLQQAKLSLSYAAAGLY